ncbi:DUF4089 domain-containing protein [Methylobacterium oryzihabitans]|uniref:DUF4089 domain-containing protein n=1 Tax=Methylobacterium oryzihabitans TaxID=2499852 RepID=A0A437P0N3_9HYPH|nr:DUF4089 domain-containing protein [Methylobacterium oryzihabitans]RVU15787.1 DUF4089 domain-containing protein [Methylobacterium oryzihabitans]
MSPSPDPAALGAYVDAAAPLLGLAIAPDWHEGVVAHLSAILAAGARFDGFALPDEAEAAPVFEAAP